jgi:hypothetical protein
VLMVIYLGFMSNRLSRDCMSTEKREVHRKMASYFKRSGRLEGAEN